MVKIGFFKAEVSCLHWNLTYVLANHISYCIWCFFPNFQWSWIFLTILHTVSSMIFSTFIMKRGCNIFLVRFNFHCLYVIFLQFLSWWIFTPLNLLIAFFEKKDFSYLMIISYVVAISHISNFNDVCYPIQFLLFWLITSDINCHLFSSDSSHSNKMANALKNVSIFEEGIQNNFVHWKMWEIAAITSDKN